MKCLFPAAGYGTRFLPATKAMPKEMLPIVDKPLIQYGVEEAFEAGIRDISIITGRTKRAIEDHFDKSYELEHHIEGTKKELLLKEINHLIGSCSFSYTRQKQMRGLGDAILTGYPLIGNEPFGVVLADDLCLGYNGGVLSQMVALYKQYKCSIVAIEEVPKDKVNRYGIVKAKPLNADNPLVFEVEDMVEKPEISKAPSNLAIIGRYILTPDIFEILENTLPSKNGEIQITDALLHQVKTQRVLAYKFDGIRFDCGQVEGFIEATNYFYNKNYK